MSFLVIKNSVHICLERVRFVPVLYGRSIVNFTTGRNWEAGGKNIWGVMEGKDWRQSDSEMLSIKSSSHPHSISAWVRSRDEASGSNFFSICLSLTSWLSKRETKIAMSSAIWISSIKRTRPLVGKGTSDWLELVISFSWIGCWPVTDI